MTRTIALSLESNGLSRMLHQVFVLLLASALGLKAAIAGTTVYVYDVHGRLKTVTSPNGATDQTVSTYTFDNAANRQSLVVNVIDLTRPNPPTSFTASSQAFDWIRLNWTPSTDVGGGIVPYYKVYRGGSYIASATLPPYDDRTVAANTSYTYTVSAVDSSANESIGNPSASATTPPGADIVGPSIPGNLQGVPISGTAVSMTWSPSTDTGGSGLAGYRVFRGGAHIGSPTVASFMDSSLTPATTYSYRVLAFDGAGNSSDLSTQISVTTLDTLGPNAPGVPTFAAITGSSATASWTAAWDNVGVVGYRYSLNGGSSWTNVGSALSVSLSGLVIGTTYTVYVQAVDAVGNWGSSSSASFTTNAYYTDTMTLVSGTTGDGINSPLWNGYVQGVLGSLTPNTTINGKTVGAYYSYYQLGFDGINWYVVQMGTNLRIGGFSGVPSSDWLQTPAGETATCYEGGCNWSWPEYTPSMPTTLMLVHK
jgi:chitodextrinase